MATSPSRLCQFAQTSLKIDAAPPPPTSLAGGDRRERRAARCNRITSSSALSAGQPVAQHRVVDRAVLLRQRRRRRRARGRSRRTWARIETPRSKPSSRHRDPPAVAGLADDQVGGGPGAGEEHLVELRAAGQLLDRPDLDAVLVDRDQQERQPVVPLGAGLGARDDEEPLAELRVGRPDLLAVDHPVVAVQPGLGLHVGQVGAGAGLGVALRPQLLDGQDLRAGTAAAAPCVPNAISVGPSSSSPRWLTRAGAFGSRVLLVEDHLLPEREAAAAVLLRASPRRSSRARRGAGSRPAAPGSPRAPCPGRRAP